VDEELPYVVPAVWHGSGSKPVLNPLDHTRHHHKQEQCKNLDNNRMCQQTCEQTETNKTQSAAAARSSTGLRSSQPSELKITPGMRSTSNVVNWCPSHTRQKHGTTSSQTRH